MGSKADRSRAWRRDGEPGREEGSQVEIWGARQGGGEHGREVGSSA